MGTGTSLIAELALENEGNAAEIEMIKGMGTISFVGKLSLAIMSFSPRLTKIISSDLSWGRYGLFYRNESTV